MTTYDTSDRYALRALLGGNAVSDIDAGFLALRNDISAKLTPYDAGLLSARPVSTMGTPGIAGRKYFATDTGEVYLDLGTSWKLVASGENAWQDATLSTGIVNVGAGYPNAGGRLEPGGVVRLHGGLNNTSAGAINTLATLPVPLRPAKQTFVIAQLSSGDVMRTLVVNTDGTLQTVTAVPAHTGPLWLDGVTYTV